MAAKPKRKKTAKAIRESRSLAAKRGWETRKAEFRKRSKAAKKGWQTRRARETLARSPKEKSKVQRKVERLEKQLTKKEKRSQKRQQEEIRQQKTKQELIEENRKLRAENADLRNERKRKRFIDREVEKYVDRFKHLTMLDGLPPQRINESRDKWTYRIVRTLVKEGVYTREQAYRAVSKHTGANISEVYSMFVYIGMGEMVA